MPTLHIALDESGDLNFSPSGSRYYIFAAAWTYDPAPFAHALTELRFSLLKQGHDLVAFHATEDRQAHRDAVVDILAGTDHWRFAAIVVDKPKVHPTLREPEKFYPRFALMVLRFILRGRLYPQADRVLIFTDSLPVKRRRETAEKAIKTACRAELLDTMPFYSYHHHRASNCWIQAADYCSWAIYRKSQSGDARTCVRLQPRLARPELDVLREGAVTYY